MFSGSGTRFMKITVRQITIGATIAALLLFIAATFWMIGYLSPVVDPVLRLEYLRFSLEVYKAVGIGFLITLLGVAIPNILPEARYEFENQKASREIYSRVKTGIIYLPYELAEMSLSDASAHIKNLHFQKHMAETYPQTFRARRWLNKTAYFKIEAAHMKLFEKKDWDSLSPSDRLKVLLSESESELQ